MKNWTEQPQMKDLRIFEPFKRIEIKDIFDVKNHINLNEKNIFWLSMVNKCFFIIQDYEITLINERKKGYVQGFLFIMESELIKKINTKKDLLKWLIIRYSKSVNNLINKSYE